MPRTIFVFHSIAFLCHAFGSCSYFTNSDVSVGRDSDSLVVFESLAEKITTDTTVFDPLAVFDVTEKPTDTGKGVSPEHLLAYAKTLLGTTYKYASIDPAEGLDCSGFITHVFNHFSIQVPRSSIDFTNYGITVSTIEAKPGDLILFTGTDTLVEVVGHMGIVSAVTGELLEFIHSTSGRAYGVTITTLNEHYRKRFVKLIRIPYRTTARM